MIVVFRSWLKSEFNSCYGTVFRIFSRFISLTPLTVGCSLRIMVESLLQIKFSVGCSLRIITEFQSISVRKKIIFRFSVYSVRILNRTDWMLNLTVGSPFVTFVTLGFNIYLFYDFSKKIIYRIKLYII